MDKEKYFIENFQYLSKKAGVELEVLIEKDNRLKYYVASVNKLKYIDGNKEYFYRVRYNTKVINKVSKDILLFSISHEIGHIKKGHFKCPRINDISKLEYQAEKYGLDLIKKVYGLKKYKKAIKFLKKYSTIKKQAYRKAFTRLYKEREQDLYE